MKRKWNKCLRGLKGGKEKDWLSGTWQSCLIFARRLECSGRNSIQITMIFRKWLWSKNINVTYYILSFPFLNHIRGWFESVSAHPLPNPVELNLLPVGSVKPLDVFRGLGWGAGRWEGIINKKVNEAAAGGWTGDANCTSSHRCATSCVMFEANSSRWPVAPIIMENKNESN